MTEKQINRQIANAAARGVYIYLHHIELSDDLDAPNVRRGDCIPCVRDWRLTISLRGRRETPNSKRLWGV